MKLYLDSSAIVKLVQPAAESKAMRAFLRRHRGDELVTSALARVETVRAVLGGGPAAVAHARRQLARIYLVAVDDQILDRAAVLVPNSLRSLDAIHLASAELLGPELRVLVTYDLRMAQAAESLRMTIAAPA